MIAISLDGSETSSFTAGIDPKNSQNTRAAFVIDSAGVQCGFDFFFLDIEVGPDVLHVLVIFE